MKKAWPVRPLGELVDVLDHKRVPVSAAERAKRPGTVPYYGAAGQVGTIDRHLFDEPLLLLGEDGVQFFDKSKTKAYRVDGPSWVNNHAHVLRPRPEVDRGWLLHYLNVFDYDGYANGTTRLKLTKSSMTAIPVPAPPLDEQHRIVAVLEDHLSRLDAANGYVGAASARGRAVLRSMEGDLLVERSARQRIADVLLHSIGGIWGSAPGEDEVDVDVVRVTELRPRGRLDRSTAARRSVTSKQLAGRQLQVGDLVLEKSGGGPKTPVGRVGLVEDAPPGTIFANFMQLLRPNSDLVRPRYLHLALNALHASGKTAHLQTASTNIRNIKASEYLKLTVPVPSLPRQDELIASLESGELAVARLQQDLQGSRRAGAVLEASLLQAAFSGSL